MIERMIITLVIVGVLALLWLGWQYYKTKLIRNIQAGEFTGKPTLLYFTGEYCAVCKHQQSPIIGQIAAAFGEGLTVEQHDAAARPDLAQQYRVLTLPTTVILDGAGQAVEVNYGLAQKHKLEAQLSAIVNPHYQTLSNGLQHAA